MTIRFSPVFAALVAGVGFVSSAQALFEDNEARVALNAMRKEMVQMQGQIATLQNASQANLAMSGQLSALQQNLASLSGRIEVLENKAAQSANNSKDLYTDLDARIAKLDARLSKLEPQTVQIGDEKAEVSSNEKGLYDRGMSAFQSGDYAGAAANFGELTSKFPKSAYAPEALYWQGNAYFALQKYKEAASVEDLMIRQHPKAARTPDAMISLASAQTALGNVSAAYGTLTAVQKRFPGTEQAKLAAERAAQLKPALPAPKKK